MTTQKSWDQTFMEGFESQQAQQRIVDGVRLAGKRLRTLTRQRPVLACTLALATGYISGRLVSRI